MNKKFRKEINILRLGLPLMGIVFLTLLATPLYATKVDLNREKVESGLLQAMISNYQETKKFKVCVEKGETKYYYSVRNRPQENLPLQMGAGSYTVTTLENVSGNQYKIVSKTTLSMENKSPTDVYKNSIQIVDWQLTMKCILKAKELTKDAKTDMEKFNALYAFMVNNFVYDYDKIPTLTADYLPDNETTFTVKKGICYDYSSLFGAMLRSVGIPAKLCMGYTTYLGNEYHAWNEVYLDGKWQSVDTTSDAVYVKAKKKTDTFKTADKMKKTKEY